MHLTRTIAATIFVFISSIFACVAQKEKVENLPAFDRKRVHFGFTLGINSSDFILNYERNDSLLVLESQRQPGLNLGIVSALHMGKYFSLRFIPQLSFASRVLEYKFVLPGTGTTWEITKQIESTYIDFPLDLKYRSARLNNFAAYMVVGFKYSMDLASQIDVDNTFIIDPVVKIPIHSYSWQIGFGMDFFMQYFKFSPEIKMSYGLNNIVIHDDPVYSAPIQMLRSKIFLLSLTFEG